MVEASLEAFLAGDLPDHVALYLADDAVDDAGALAERGERVGAGTVLVVPGERGRRAFRRATGADAMAFAQEAMQQEGTVAPSLADGDCPHAAGGPQTHDPAFVLAFAEGQDSDAGGRYAEGDVVHAYAACTCGQVYSDRWVVGER